MHANKLPAVTADTANEHGSPIAQHHDDAFSPEGEETHEWIGDDLEYGYPHEAESDENNMECAPKAVKCVHPEVIGVEGTDSDESTSRVGAPNAKSRVRHVLERLVPPGGLIASAFTLGSSTLGAGILGVSAAFNMMGLVTAIIVLVVITALTIVSLWLLARCAQITGCRTYESAARAIFGKGPDYLVAVFMCLQCLGGGVSYIITLGDLLTPIFDESSVPSFLRTKSGKRLITSMIWLVCILPLCLPKRIDSLRHSSLIGVTMVIFFVICVIVDSGEHLHDNGWRSDVRFFNSGNSVVEGLGTLMFACLVQMNAFQVYFEMDKPSPLRMARNSTVAMCGCGILYCLTGIFGYARFGPQVTSSILLMYQPRRNHVFWVAYFGIVLKVCVAFALHQLPLRDAIYHFLRWDVYRMPWWKNCLCCTFFAFVILIIGLFVPNINIVFGLVGSLCGGFIGYIFPAIMIMYTGNWTLKKIGWLEWSATYLLLITGVIAAVFGTVATIYGII